jgi:hypothetical protein
MTSTPIDSTDTGDLTAQGRRKPTKAAPAVTTGASTGRQTAADEKKAAGTARAPGAAGDKKAVPGAKKVAAARSWPA